MNDHAWVCTRLSDDHSGLQGLPQPVRVCAAGKARMDVGACAAAVQLGRHLGTTVIASGSSAAKLEVAHAASAQRLAMLEPGAARLREAVLALTAVVGGRAGEYGLRDPLGGLQNRRAVEALPARGLFRPHIGARFAFGRLPYACRARAGRRVAGKVAFKR